MCQDTDGEHYSCFGWCFFSYSSTRWRFAFRMSSNDLVLCNTTDSLMTLISSEVGNVTSTIFLVKSSFSWGRVRQPMLSERFPFILQTVSCVWRCCRGSETIGKHTIIHVARALNNVQLVGSQTQIFSTSMKPLPAAHSTTNQCIPVWSTWHPLSL